MSYPNASRDWRISDELWAKLQPLLPPSKPHPLGCHRLRVPTGEEALREVIVAIADAGRAGKETIVKRAKMLLGRRVL